MTEQTRYPSQPIELGSRIEISRKLIQDLKPYKLSQAEQNIIIRYVRNGEDFNLIVPTCPDYLPDKTIYSQESAIIGSEIPETLFPILETANMFYSAVQEKGLQIKLQVLISNPRYGGIELTQVKSQKVLIEEAYANQKKKITNLLINRYPEITFEVADFGEKFGYPRVSSIEEEYIDVLNSLYQSNSGFKETVQRKIEADGPKIRVDHRRFVGVNQTIPYEDFAIKKIIRNIAENLAFGDLVSKTEENPIICSPIKRGNMTNQRNKIKLLKYGRDEQLTIPIISPNQ